MDDSACPFGRLNGGHISGRTLHAPKGLEVHATYACSQVGFGGGPKTEFRQLPPVATVGSNPDGTNFRLLVSALHAFAAHTALLLCGLRSWVHLSPLDGERCSTFSRAHFLMLLHAPCR